MAPFRAIFSGDMKDFLKGIDLNKVPLEFVTKISVNFSSGNSFTFKPDMFSYKTEEEFLEKLGMKLRKLKEEIKFVDFEKNTYIGNTKLKTILMKIKDVDRFLRLSEQEKMKPVKSNQKKDRMNEDWKNKTAKKPVEKRRWRSQ